MIFVLLVIAISIFLVGIMEVAKDNRNPLPKFENGDKRIDCITVEKTRSII